MPIYTNNENYNNNYNDNIMFILRAYISYYFLWF